MKKASPLVCEPLSGDPSLKDLRPIDEWSDQSSCDVDAANDTLSAALRKAEKLAPAEETKLFKKMRFLQIRAKALRITLDEKRPEKNREREIASLTHESEQARDRIAVAHLRLIASIVGRLSKSHREFDEFFSEGTSILLYAIEKFDHTKGFRLSTYVTHAVQRHLYRLIQKRTKRANSEMSADQQLLQAETAAPDRSTPFRNDQGAAITKKVLHRIDEILDERERSVVRGRFGLDGTGEEKTYQALGEQLGLSKERARQLFNRGIKKLGEQFRPMADDLM